SRPKSTLLLRATIKDSVKATAEMTGLVSAISASRHGPAPASSRSSAISAEESTAIMPAGRHHHTESQQRAPHPALAMPPAMPSWRFPKACAGARPVLPASMDEATAEQVSGRLPDGRVGSGRFPRPLLPYERVRSVGPWHR